MFWSSSASRPVGPSGWMDSAGDNFPGLIDYTRRLSYLLSVSRPAAEIAVLYPMSSLWLADTAAHQAEQQLSRLLLESQRDFDFIDEYALSHVLKNHGGKLHNLSGQSYRVVLVPPATAISAAALDRLEAFAHSGGKVVFLERKPTLLVERTFRDAGRVAPVDWALFEPSIRLSLPGIFPYTNEGYTGEYRTDIPEYLPAPALTPALLEALPEPVLELGEPCPEIKHLHKKLKDSDLFFLFNEGEKNRTKQENLKNVTNNTRKNIKHLIFQCAFFSYQEPNSLKSGQSRRMIHNHLSGKGLHNLPRQIAFQLNHSISYKQPPTTKSDLYSPR